MGSNLLTPKSRKETHRKVYLFSGSIELNVYVELTFRNIEYEKSLRTAMFLDALGLQNEAFLRLN